MAAKQREAAALAALQQIVHGSNVQINAKGETEEELVRDTAAPQTTPTVNESRIKVIVAQV